MNDTNDMMMYDVELSERETFFIGKIVALWAALEHEVFVQTLKTFDVASEEQINLPKEMNNLQFTGVLNLWKGRVVDAARGKRKHVLDQQHQRILQLHEFRKAIVHGMWDWSPADVERITSTRVVGKKIIAVHFTADDLQSFAMDLHRINYKLRYPRGTADFAQELSKQGFSVSRRFAAMMAGHSLADELLNLPKSERDAGKLKDSDAQGE